MVKLLICIDHLTILEQNSEEEKPTTQRIATLQLKLVLMISLSKMRKWLYKPIVFSSIISLGVLNTFAANITTVTTEQVSSRNISRPGDLSFYFQNIDIRTLLQLIAKNSGLNFIISDAVKGSITLNLKDVTWQEALDIILRTHGLASRRVGDVMFISTLEDITGNEAKQMQSEDALMSLAPLKSILIHLKYTIAGELAKILKGAEGSLLTARGQVAVDTRTNSLIIRDTQVSLDSILPQILKLDVPARQVLIEARIVNIDTTYEEN